MIVEKSNVFLFCEKNATKFGTENEVSHKIIMRWKKSYYIATNVSSRKGAPTIGDLSDWSKEIVKGAHNDIMTLNARTAHNQEPIP